MTNGHRAGRVRPRLPVAVTAAGRQVDLTNRNDVRRIDARPFKWQRESITYYDIYGDNPVGEVWFAGNYIANSLSRLRLFVAVQPDLEDAPLSITDEKLDAQYRPTDQEIAACTASIGRLSNSQGGQSDILRAFGLNGFLCGEGFLVGRQIDGYEEWQVHSVEQMVANPNKQGALSLKIMPDDKPDAYVDLTGATVVRVWRRHPIYPEMPDAAMGAARVYCEDLILYRDMIRAAGNSRIPAGVWGIPEEAGMELPDDEEDADGDNTARDPLSEEILRHLTTPLQDRKSAAALVPFILRMSADDLEKVQKWDFSRPIDELAVRLREECRTALAATVDLPSDVLTGKQGLNDWSAWNVDEQTFRVHLAPHAELICRGLTAGYLWPMLSAGDTRVDNPRRFMIWYDADELVIKPNRAENAERGHKAMVISDAAYRDALGFDDADAPDDTEIERRIEIARAIRELPGTSTNLDNPAGGAENGAPTPGGQQDTQASAAPISPALIAAGQQSLGYRLALIERSLMSRLLVSIDAEVRNALKRAGNRVATAARPRRVGEQIRSIVSSCPPSQVIAHLGPELIAALGLTNDALLDGAFENLEPRWDAWVAQAQREGRAAIVEEGEALADDEDEAFEQTDEQNRAAGWAVLLAALVATTTKVMYGANEPTSLGERDSSLVVTAAVLRDALSTAGGGPRPGAANAAAHSGEGRGGLLSGETVRDIFRAAAVEELGWVWVYGDPATRTFPFEPHMDLDGVTFDSWEVEELHNPDPFPEVDFYFPGDHDGCQCTFARDGRSTVSGSDDTEEGGD